jgi:hypothetical protein
VTACFDFCVSEFPTDLKSLTWTPRDDNGDSFCVCHDSARTNPEDFLLSEYDYLDDNEVYYTYAWNPDVPTEYCD